MIGFLCVLPQDQLARNLVNDGEDRSQGLPKVFNPAATSSKDASARSLPLRRSGGERAASCGERSSGCARGESSGSGKGVFGTPAHPTRVGLQSQRARRLIAHPTPRQLHHQAAHVPIPGARNSLIVGRVAALVRRGHQAGQGTSFPPVLDLPPAEDLGG